MVLLYNQLPGLLPLLFSGFLEVFAVLDIFVKLLEADPFGLTLAEHPQHIVEELKELEAVLA